MRGVYRVDKDEGFYNYVYVVGRQVLSAR